MAGGLHPCTRSAVVLTHTSQLGPCSSLGVFSPLSLYLLCSAQGQTFPWESQRRHTRPGLITSKLFDGLIWEDTFVSAYLPLAQLKGMWVQSKIDYFFSLGAHFRQTDFTGRCQLDSACKFFPEKFVFRSSKKVFPYRYVPVETACLNCLTRRLQSSSKTQALLMVRTGISAITSAFLFRKDHPESFFGEFCRIANVSAGEVHMLTPPVAIFLSLSLQLQISLLAQAVTITTNFSPHFFWVLCDDQVCLWNHSFLSPFRASPALISQSAPCLLLK